jgi:hypothetical protein
MPEEWDKLLTLLPVESIPLPNAASAAVAEHEDGSLAGVLIGQLVVHIEPLVLTSPKVSFKALFETLLEPLSEFKGLTYYAFSDSAVVAGMTEHLGMQAKPYQVWEGRIR